MVSKRDSRVGTAGRAAMPLGAKSGGTWLFWTAWTSGEADVDEGDDGSRREEVIAP